MRRAPANPAPVSGGPTDVIAEAPLLLALFLAPLVASYQNPLAPLLLCSLIWIALLLRVALPGQLPLRAPVSSRVAGLLLVLLPTIAALSFVPSVNRGATLIQTVLYAGYAALACLAADRAAHGAARHVLGALVGGALIAGGLGLQEWGIEARAGNPGWRAFPLFSNPNFYAGYLAPALLLTFGLSFRRPEAFKPLMWLLAMGLVVAALASAAMLTGSRGGLASLGIGLGYLLLGFLVRRQYREREGALRMGALLGIVVLCGIAFSGVILARDTTTPAERLPAKLCPTVAESATADSNRFRFYTWQASRNMGMKRPILGWGAGSFETAFMPHAIADYTRHAHSGFFQFFAEEGAPGVVAWVAALLAALLALVRAPRTPEWHWTAGAAGVLAATAAHNTFDSIVYVPATALLTWAVIGLSLGTPPAGGDAGMAAAAEGRARQTGGRWRTVWIVVGCLGLVLTGIHAMGRLLLEQGREELRRNPAGALETLDAAQSLLPLDHEVADAQRRALIRPIIGRWEEGLRSAQRAIDLAPLRVEGYLFRGDLLEYQQEYHRAITTYNIGLDHAPNHVGLLYNRALLWEKMGSPEDALRSYQRLVEVELTPVGRVHALGDVRDYRFARAHMALARNAEGEGKAEEALQHRKAAACLLGERRLLFQATPHAFAAAYGWSERSEQVERELRADEESLWRQLTQDYRRRGEKRAAELAMEQAGSVSAGDASLEKTLETLRADTAALK